MFMKSLSAHRQEMKLLWFQAALPERAFATLTSSSRCHALDRNRPSQYKQKTNRTKEKTQNEKNKQTNKKSLRVAFHADYKRRRSDL